MPLEILMTRIITQFQGNKRQKNAKSPTSFSETQHRL